VSASHCSAATRRKSTLVRLVTVSSTRRKDVWVGDWDTAGLHGDLARRVGSVFQHPDQQLFARTLREDVASDRARWLPGA